MEEYMIIRGKRINDQLELLTEHSTYNQLKSNVDSFIPLSTKRQNSKDPLYVEQLMMLPMIGTRNLNVEATVRNTSSNSLGDAKKGTNNGHGTSAYAPRIIFNGVEFDDESTDTNITFTGKDGNEYNMQQIDLGQNTVRVRCTCGDFFWRFAAFNARDKSLIGTAPTPYQRKTNRGPVNPKQVPGVCKHLIKMFEELKADNVVR